MRSKRHQNSPSVHATQWLKPVSIQFNCKKIAPRMHQNSPFLAQQSKNFLWKPSPNWEADTPSLHPIFSAPSAPRSSRLRRSISAPSALDLGAYSASVQASPFAPLATPSGSAPKVKATFKNKVPQKLESSSTSPILLNRTSCGFRFSFPMPRAVYVNV